MQTQEIEIPARLGVPKTFLRVRVISSSVNTPPKKPYVFILPGGPGSNHSFYLGYDCLSEIANLVYYDPRGCGLSDAGDIKTYNMENYIHDLKIVKQYLQLDSIILLGKSYGAMCALGYALRFPDDVKKLILAAGAPSYKFIETARSNLLSRGTAEQQKVCQNLWEGNIQNDADMDEYFKIMGTMYSWKKRNNQVINRIEPTHRFSFEALNQGFSNQFGYFNYSNDLKNLRCSTLILAGEDDWITDPVYSQEMANKIPNSIIKIFANADHAMESDVPEQYFQSIKDFVSNDGITQDF
jgi:proline iminopeptidase